METWISTWGIFRKAWFLPYLWGMETRMRSKNEIYSMLSFLPYLWGMETDDAPVEEVLIDSSYRTYEEWKLLFRDVKYRIIEFLPYLWGMETCLHHINMILNKAVLTVPMRNGNIEVVSMITYAILVLTVPMRNGNVYMIVRIGFHFKFLPYLWGMETIWWLRLPVSPVRVLTVPMRNGNQVSVWWW